VPQGGSAAARERPAGGSDVGHEVNLPASGCPRPAHGVETVETVEVRVGEAEGAAGKRLEG
jgi:hypothetical protein